LLQVEVTEIVGHEADEPNAVVDFLDSEPLAGEDGRDVDFFAVQAEAAAGSDETLAIVEGVFEVGQAAIGAFRGGIAFGWALHKTPSEGDPATEI